MVGTCGPGCEKAVSTVSRGGGGGGRGVARKQPVQDPGLALSPPTRLVEEASSLLPKPLSPQPCQAARSPARTGVCTHHGAACLSGACRWLCNQMFMGHVLCPLLVWVRNKEFPLSRCLRPIIS